MGYVLKAVLSSAQHPEYGQITIPFPVPDEEYGCMIPERAEVSVFHMIPNMTAAM